MAKQDNYKWPEHFTLAVLVVPALGLEVANVGKSWTPLLAKDTGMKVHLAHTSDKVNKFKWVHLGIADMADGGQHELSRVLEGDRRYGVVEYCGQNYGRRAVVYGNRDCGAFPYRAIWVHSKYDSGFMVRGDSKIKDIYDIKPGIRVVDMRPYLSSQRNVEGLFAWAKIDETEVVWVPAHSTDEKVRLVVEGKADIAWVIPSAPSTYEAERNPHGLRWIDLNSDKDPEGAKRFREKYLLIGFGPMVRGVKSAHGHWGTIGTDLFCCHESADTEFVYHLAKWMDENYPRYKDLHYWLPAMSRQNLMEELDTTFIPCHEGLIKYLKELKLWTPEHEKRNQQNAALVDRYVKATQEAHIIADEKGIIVAAENQEWVDLWEAYKKKLNLPVCDILPSLHKGRPESK